MTSNLYFNNLYGRVSANANSCELGSLPGSAGYPQRNLSIRSTSYISEISDALYLVDTNSSGTATLYKIFGEHSKKSGSYTGNGNSTSRTITTKSYGHFVCIWSEVGIVFVTPMGAFCKKTSATTITGLAQTVCKCANGTITITSSDNLINGNNVAYSYMFL